MKPKWILAAGLAACSGTPIASTADPVVGKPPDIGVGPAPTSKGVTTIDRDLYVEGTCTLGDTFHDTFTGRDLLVGRNGTISGNLHVAGNLQVSGSTFFTTNVPGIDVGQFDVSTVYDDWAPPGWSTNVVFRVRAADNEGTRITGAAAGNPGDVRILVNMSAPIDDGILVLRHEDPRSLPENRFLTPNEDDYYVPKNGSVILWYDGISMRWVLLERGSRMQRVVAQSLGVFPDALSDVISGEVDDWSPIAIAAQNATYASGLGAAGDSLAWKDNTLWRVQVAASGATITGMASAGNNDPFGFHPLKILLNYGPGALTFKHASAASQQYNQFQLPGGQDVVVPPTGTAVFIWVYGWQLLALGQPNGNGRVNANVVTTNGLVASGSVTPPALPAGRVDNWIPAGVTSAIRIRAQADPTGTTITGLVGAVDGIQFGDVKIMINFGGPLTLTHLDPASDLTRQFLLPNSASLVIPTYGSVTLTYDDTQKWVVTGKSF